MLLSFDRVWRSAGEICRLCTLAAYARDADEQQQAEKSRGNDQLRSGYLELPATGFRPKFGPAFRLFLCALCNNEHLCGSAQRQME